METTQNPASALREIIWSETRLDMPGARRAVMRLRASIPDPCSSAELQGVFLAALERLQGTLSQGLPPHIHRLNALAILTRMELDSEG
jgi:hypothetical protein